MVRVVTKIPNARADAGDYIRSVGYRRYFIGVDLATMHDFTAVTVLEDEHVPAPTYGTGFKQLMLPRTLRIRQAFRLKRGMPYPDQVSFLGNLLLDETLEDSAEMWIDIGGAGRAVAQLMEEQDIPHVGLMITSGDHWKKINNVEYRTSKQYLLNKFSLAFATGELEISSHVQDREELLKQLADYQVEITKAGNITMNASIGQHDDLIISSAAAYFAAKHKPSNHFSANPISWG